MKTLELQLDKPRITALTTLELQLDKPRKTALTALELQLDKPRTTALTTLELQFDKPSQHNPINHPLCHKLYYWYRLQAYSMGKTQDCGSGQQ